MRHAAEYALAQSRVTVAAHDEEVCCNVHSVSTKHRDYAVTLAWQPIHDHLCAMASEVRGNIRPGFGAMPALGFDGVNQYDAHLVRRDENFEGLADGTRCFEARVPRHHPGL